jgi:hypothetical protein
MKEQNNLTKNIAFTALIKINGRLHEFNFRKRGETYYDVDTNDERGQRLFIKVEKQEEAWKLIDRNLPGWLLNSEVLIDDAIKNEEYK